MPFFKGKPLVRKNSNWGMNLIYLIIGITFFQRFKSNLVKNNGCPRLNLVITKELALARPVKTIAKRHSNNSHI